MMPSPTRLHQIIENHDPDSTALIEYDGTSFTYGALDVAVSQAATLLQQHTVQAGDRVVIICENSGAAVAFTLAASRLDAWAVPVNARQTAYELDRIIAHATPRVVVFATAASPEAKAHADRLQAIPHSASYGEISLSTPHPSASEKLCSGADQVAVMLYTTGTTGAPKGVMLTHGNMLFGANVSANLRKMAIGDKSYAALPMTHVFGLASVVMAGLLAGITVRLCNRFNTDALYRAITEEGITLLPAVPQMYAALMQFVENHPDANLKGSKLRYISSGGAPLDPAWKQAVEGFFGLPLQNGYGMTETTAGVCATSTADFTDDVSVGPLLPGVEVRINTPDSDGIGEILTRGAHIMAGYYKDPDETAKVLSVDGWMHTGDMGYLDNGGRLHVSGRKKELIIRSGFNVFPPEVEAALSDHPDVAIAAVIGRATDGNEEVLAFVQPAPGATIDVNTLKAHTASRLSGYKCPSHIFVVEKLPATATGKILKAKLSDMIPEE